MHRKRGFKKPNSLINLANSLSNFSFLLACISSTGLRNLLVKHTEQTLFLDNSNFQFLELNISVVASFSFFTILIFEVNKYSVEFYINMF